MKFCINCKHYQADKPSLFGGEFIKVDWCLKSPEYDLVNGQLIYRFANVERAIVNEPNHCNKTGDWFEIKEAADLDDLSTIPFGR